MFIIVPIVIIVKLNKTENEKKIQKQGFQEY